MSKTHVKYMQNYHAATRKTLLERIIDHLKAFADWYCGVGKE